MTEPDGVRGLSAAEIELIVDRAVDRAVEKTMEATRREIRSVLLTLGLNADSPSHVLESQKDAAWTRRVRVLSETAPGKIGLLMFGTLLTAIGGLITFFVKHFFDSAWRGPAP